MFIKTVNLFSFVTLRDDYGSFRCIVWALFFSFVFNLNFGDFKKIFAVVRHLNLYSRNAPIAAKVNFISHCCFRAFVAYYRTELQFYLHVTFVAWFLLCISHSIALASKQRKQLSSDQINHTQKKFNFLFFSYAWKQKHLINAFNTHREVEMR